MIQVRNWERTTKRLRAARRGNNSKEKGFLWERVMGIRATSTVKKTSFTPREVDVISCMVVGVMDTKVYSDGVGTVHIHNRKSYLQCAIKIKTEFKKMFRSISGKSSEP